VNVRWSYMMPTFTVACGKCKQEYDTCFGCHTRTTAAAWALANGWVRTRAWGWVGPECEGSSTDPAKPEATRNEAGK